MRPTQERLQSLWLLCRAFVTERKISCPETIWQTDRVTEDIESFIERICETVGYAPSKKDEEDDE